MTDPKPMPWPEFDRQGYLDPPDDVYLEYERAMKEAALSRLRVAVAKLQAIDTLKITNRDESTGKEWPGSYSDLSMCKSEMAREALSLIGPVPPP